MGAHRRLTGSFTLPSTYTMSVTTIRKARRSGARLLIMLAGVSGSGKTRTALEIGYGLTNRDPSKIGVLDAENRRGSLYSDVFAKPDRPDRSDEPFLIGDLFSPFSPDRYVEAIHQFQREGVRVLIIDSASHEWEGIGGCIEIAEGNNPNKPNWAKGKAAHKKFMNAVLTCDMDIILCFRAREKAKPERQMVDGKEKLVYVPLGLQPITEQNVLFEATVSLMLHDCGTRQDVVKCPDVLLPYLGRGTGHITADDGAALRQWVDGAEPVDPKVEKWRNRLISITDHGVAHVERCWAEVPKGMQAKLGLAFKATLIASASEYEKQAKEANGGGDHDNLADLNAAVAGAKPPANDNSPPASDAADVAE